MLALQYELLKKEEQGAGEEQPYAALEQEAIVPASVGASGDQLEKTPADTLDKIVDHESIVARPC
jgi:hypothetical protein